jgi:hypothetical protein
MGDGWIHDVGDLVGVTDHQEKLEKIRARV